MYLLEKVWSPAENNSSNRIDAATTNLRVLQPPIFKFLFLTWQPFIWKLFLFNLKFLLKGEQGALSKIFFWKICVMLWS